MTETPRYRLLPGLPPYGEPARPFPESWGRRGREGVVVAFQPRSGPAWTGNFAPGQGGASAVHPHPDGRRVLVLSAGDLWVVDPEAGSAELAFEGVAGLWPVPDGFVVNRDGLAFARLGPGGVVWRTRRLSWDGFDGIQVDDHELRGMAWDPTGDAWLPFVVDLATGASRGGSFGEGDHEGWERLAPPPAAASRDAAPAPSRSPERTTATAGAKRHRWWTRLMVVGFGCGVAVGARLDWFFTAGPGSSSLDAGEAHGLWLMIVGFPAVFLLGPVAVVLPELIGRALIVLSVGVSWALPWLALYVVQRLDEPG